MKILVPIKRVVDYKIQVHPTADGKAVDISGLKMSPNPFDENAIEEAIRLKEAGTASEVVMVSFGTESNHDVLRHGLAMGADRAILVKTDKTLGSLGIAKLLKALIEKEAPNLVLMGKQSVDDDAGQAPQMLAGLLGWAQGTFVSQLTIENQTAHVVREVDGGTESLSLKLPAVISADLRLNAPRFVKLPNLMMAKKKPIESIEAETLLPLKDLKVKTIAVEYPASRGPAKILNSVDELINALKNEAGVL